MNDVDSEQLAPSFMPYTDAYSWKPAEPHEYHSPSQAAVPSPSIVIPRTGGNKGTKGNKKGKKGKKPQNKTKQTKNDRTQTQAQTAGVNAYTYPYAYPYPYPHLHPQQQQFTYGGHYPQQYAAPHTHYAPPPPHPHAYVATPNYFNMGLNTLPPFPRMGSHGQLTERDKALSQMLLAWYWAGYYAGLSARSGP